MFCVVQIVLQTGSFPATDDARYGAAGLETTGFWYLGLSRASFHQPKLPQQWGWFPPKMEKPTPKHGVTYAGFTNPSNLQRDACGVTPF